MSAEKILFLINNLGRAGAERAFVNQANLLLQDGVDVYFATLIKPKSGGYEPELKVSADKRLMLGYKGIVDIAALRRLAEFVRKEGITTVYSTLEISNIAARLLKMIMPRLQVVTRVSGTGVVDAAGRANLKSWKFKVMDMVLNFWVDRIIVLTEDMRSLSLRYQPWHQKRFVVIGNGVNIIDTPDQVKLRNEAKLQGAVWQCLAVGSMDVSERAYEYVIEAFSLMRPEERSHWRMTFAGTGSLRSFYEAKALEYGVSDCVEFIGVVDTEKLRELYRSAHVYLLSSLSEGFPNVLLEAQSFGVPAVTTRAGGAVDLVEDGVSGFFVPFRDAQSIYDKLMWLRTHEQEWLAMGLSAYKRVRDHFALGKIVQKLRSYLFPHRV